jgi:hypothetical protein
MAAWLLQAAINMYPILFGRIWLLCLVNEEKPENCPISSAILFSMRVTIEILT